MASEATINHIHSILLEQKACHYYELVNRAYNTSRITEGVAQALAILQARDQADEIIVTSPSFKPKPIKFLYSTELPFKEVKSVITKKAELLAKHYNLSDTIGKHAEQLVFEVCEYLGYTQIEKRKEKHEGIGIGKRDIDIFARHPNNNYYQAIEVRNRHEAAKLAYLTSILRTVSIASRKWNLPIQPALVTTFASSQILELARAMDLAIALSGIQIVPEEHRDLYEELRDVVALNVEITDTPTPYLRENITRYILPHQYHEKKPTQTKQV